MLMLETILIFFLLLASLGSFNLLNFLLLMETMVLCSILAMNWTTLNWHFLYFFLVIAVCVSCYGISLLVSNTQSKNTSHFLLF